MSDADLFRPVDLRCKHCGENGHAPIPNEHDYEPITHNMSVTWTGRWELACLCGWRTSRGLETKLSAEIVAWIHLRRYGATIAREFASNRGILDYVY